MQKKTIEKVIRTKMDEWLATLPEGLAKRVKNNLLVSGGSIASLFLGEDVNDFDVYIQDRSVLMDLVRYYVKGKGLSILDETKKEQYIKAMENFEPVEDIQKYDLGDPEYSQLARAANNLKPNQIRIFMKGMAGGKKLTPNKEKTYQPVFISPNAISLTDKIQLVNRFHGSPEEIHATFDFIHATNYYTDKEGLVTNLPAVESLLTRQLKYQGSMYPITSIIRVKKFLKRKWNITAGEQLKMMFQVSELDLKNVDVLEDQLIGVDVAYFGLLIDVLQNVKVEISSSYLATLIDKIFDHDDNAPGLQADS